MLKWSREWEVIGEPGDSLVAGKCAEVENRHGFKTTVMILSTMEIERQGEKLVRAFVRDVDA